MMHSNVDKAYILSRVRVTSDGCWLWLLACYRNGYGQLHVRQPAKKGLLAHRVSYEVFVGAIPDGLDLDHLCGTRRCVNPAHLEPVTRAENLLRGAGNKKQETCRRGHSWDEDPRGPIIQAGKRTCRICTRIRKRRNLEMAR